MAYQPGEPDIPESVYGYLISLKETLLYDKVEEAEAYRDKIYAQKEKVRKLKHDRDHQFKELVLQLKEHERREELSKKIQKEEVDELVRETLMYVKDSTKLIEVLQWQISDCDKQIEELSKEVEKWTHYKDVTYPARQAHIDGMREQMDVMKRLEEQEKETLSVEILRVKKDIQDRMNMLIQQKKGNLSQNIESQLDPKTLAEYRDNRWLQREIKLQKSTFDLLAEENSTLEKRNIDIMNDLFTSQRLSPNSAHLQTGLSRRIPRLPSSPAAMEETSVRGDTQVEVYKVKREDSLEHELIRRTEEEKMLQMEKVSLEPLGLVELRKMRLSGRPMRQRPVTHEGVKLPPLEQNCESIHSRKPSWPISVRMLKSILT